MAKESAKMFAGQIGLVAVLVNVLVDKGVVDREDLAERFRQARDAAAESDGDRESAAVLDTMVKYLGGPDRRLQ